MTPTSRTTAALGVGAVALALAWWAWPRDETGDGRRTTSESGSRAPADARELCDHRYVPHVVGDLRTYRWGSEDGIGTVSIELTRARAMGEGVVLTWIVEDETGTRSEIQRVCDSRGAEEPWLVLGSAATLAVSDQAWRVPFSLQIGDQFGGAYDVELAGMSVSLERTHRVVARERISAAGETFDAVRIDVEERAVSGSALIPMTQWVSERVGLVRMWLGPDEHRMEVELVSYTGSR